MKVQLSTGEAHVHVRYCSLLRHPDEPPRRATTVSITTADGSTFEGQTLCAPQDQYCRVEGRKRALRRAIQEQAYRGAVWGRLLKEDRRALWRAVCPDLLAPRSNGIPRVLREVITSARSTGDAKNCVLELAQLAKLEMLYKKLTVPTRRRKAGGPALEGDKRAS